VLLPQEEWGEHDLSTTVNKRALALVMAIGVIALALMYAGDGGWLTFAGIGLFMIFMWQITRISLAAVEMQAQRFKATREELGEEPDAEAEAAGGDEPAQ